MTDDEPETLEQTEARETEERQTAEREIDDMRRVVSTIEGRRLMWRLLTMFGLLTQIHSERDMGTHDAALALVTDIKAAGPGYWSRMILENDP